MAVKKSSSLRPSRPKNVKIAIVMSRFNEAVSRALLQGARQSLDEAGVPESSVSVFDVPGAFEIPLAALSVAQSGKYDGVVCLGAVVRGETSHFDYICQGTADGIMRAQLETGVPMGFGVLTTETMEQAEARAGANPANKGFEAAQVVLEMVELLRRMRRT